MDATPGSKRDGDLRDILTEWNPARIAADCAWEVPEAGDAKTALDSPMRLAVDMRWMTPGLAGGIEQVARAFLGELLAIDRYNRCTLIVPWQVAHGIDLRRHPRVRVTSLDGPAISPRRAWQTIRRQLSVTLRGNDWPSNEVLALEWVRSLDAEMVYAFPGYTHPDVHSLPQILMVPDIQHEYWPGFFAPQALAERIHVYRDSIQRATRICAISEFTRQTLIDKLGVAPDKITTVHLAAGQIFRDDPGATDTTIWRRYDLEQGRFIFFPGHTWYHKNHLAAVRALALLRDEHGIRLPLVCSGGAREAQSAIDDEVDALGLRGAVRFLGYCPDEHLPALYRGAACLLFPSLFEGFGMPVLEAMACGCPVVCSNTTSLPEIGGDAALLVDPQNPHALAQAVANVLRSQELHDRMRERGLARARQFSWRRHTTQTLRVLYEVHQTLRGVRSTTAETIPVSTTTRSMTPLPKISVVTSSFNQGRFIARTIESVLAQDYPNLEHIVVDGMSSDGTAEILSRYPHLRVIREPDSGQADAINKGFRSATGEIFCFLNSDDTFEPGALHRVVRELGPAAGRHVVMGRCRFVDEDDRFIGVEHPSEYQSHRRVLSIWKGHAIPQPAVFWTREVWERCGQLDEHELWLDYDLFCRFSRDYVFHTFDQIVANYRLHTESKTLGTSDAQRLVDSVRVSRRYWPPLWTPAGAGIRLSWAWYRFDRRGRAFRILQAARSHWHEGRRAAGVARVLAGALLAPDVALAGAASPLARRAAGPAQALVKLVTLGRGRLAPQTKAWRGFTRLHDDGWAGPRVELMFDRTEGAGGCELLFEGSTFAEALPGPLVLTLSVPGVSPVRVQVGRQREFSTRLPITHLAPGRHGLTVVANRFLVPHTRFGNGDYRPLSFRLLRIQAIAESTTR